MVRSPKPAIVTQYRQGAHNKTTLTLSNQRGAGHAAPLSAARIGSVTLGWHRTVLMLSGQEPEALECPLLSCTRTHLLCRQVYLTRDKHLPLPSPFISWPQILQGTAPWAGLPWLAHYPCRHLNPHWLLRDGETTMKPSAGCRSRSLVLNSWSRPQ